MHFQKRYIRLIEHYQHNESEHGEWHHIIPKCLGGKDDNTNLVFLPYKAHYICHWLLTKIYPDNRKLQHAFAMMCVVNSYQERKYTASQYARARESRKNALRGVPRTEETKNKLRKPKRNKENYKKPKTFEHRLNIGKAHKGKKHHWHDKIVNSEGYKLHRLKQKNERLIIESFHRQNFLSLGISRKEYYTLFSNIPSPTIKRYLRGL